MLRCLGKSEQIAKHDITQPLRSAISWKVPGNIRAWVEARLRTWGGIDNGCKLCVIGRQGYTATGKNWGHRWREDLPLGQQREGEECHEFMRLLRRKDSAWSFVTMEECSFHSDHTVHDTAFGCVSYYELFGKYEENAAPFGLVFKTLLDFADLVVGVPAGPYHLAMAKPDLPTVGIWTEHLPSWYDEPKACSYHLISRNLQDNRAIERPGSFFEKGEMKFRMRQLESRIIPGEDVLLAVEELLGLPSSSSTNKFKN